MDRHSGSKAESAGWRLLLLERSVERVHIVQGMLEAQGVATHLLDQRDSMYPSLGTIQLYVWTEDWGRAQALLREYGVDS